jgi:hypothetical protein
MPRDNVQQKEKANIDTDWTPFSDLAESKISHLQERIEVLRKSLKFFKKQQDDGVAFPKKSG